MTKFLNILKWIVLAIALAVDIFILVNAFVDGASSAAESGKMAHAVANEINAIKPGTITDQNFPKFHYNFRKLVGHFGLFGFAGIFNSWAYYLFFKNNKLGYYPIFIAIILGFGLLLASLSELAQFAPEGRGPALSDVGIDFAGYFLGTLFIFIILLIKKSKVFKK